MSEGGRRRGEAGRSGWGGGEGASARAAARRVGGSARGRLGAQRSPGVAMLCAAASSAAAATAAAAAAATGRRRRGLAKAAARAPAVLAPLPAAREPRGTPGGFTGDELLAEYADSMVEPAECSQRPPERATPGGFTGDELLAEYADSMVEPALSSPPPERAAVRRGMVRPATREAKRLLRSEQALAAAAGADVDAQLNEDREGDTAAAQEGAEDAPGCEGPGGALA